MARVLLELLQLAARVQYPRRSRCFPALPSESLVAIQTTPFVLHAAAAPARLIADHPRRAGHRFLAFFAFLALIVSRLNNPSNCAFAAKTSATASLNSRPCSTSGRTSSTHSSGIRSTCFLP